MASFYLFYFFKRFCSAAIKSSLFDSSNVKALFSGSRYQELLKIDASIKGKRFCLKCSVQDHEWCRVQYLSQYSDIQLMAGDRVLYIFDEVRVIDLQTLTFLVLGALITIPLLLVLVAAMHRVRQKRQCEANAFSQITTTQTPLASEVDASQALDFSCLQQQAKVTGL